MTAEPHRSDEIFGEALAREGDEREQYLRSACGPGADLLAEVRSLLAAHERAAGFLATPAYDPLLGQLLGVYRLTRLLGDGGMGRVYLGEREGAAFAQQVAVKVILHGAFAGEAQRRFRNECQALSRLEHPHITRLIDGGATEQGLPYIVMEFVDGTPLDAYCREHGLAVPARLRLFREVCAAVEHAHRHSILHRDIKPANILVDRDGRVKLTDFGIARVLDAAEPGEAATLTRFAVMTPQYASPEQLGGEVLSTASDVYSLGLVLYQLLTGTLPFAELTTSVRERERLIESTAPTRPSEMVRRPERGPPPPLSPRDLSGDLDAIVLMALRREPERRYASARHLADDIARHEAGQPVEARPDSLRYRLGKLVRRHAVAVVAAGLLVVVLAASTAVGFSLYGRSESARREADTERRKAERISAALIGMVEAADPMLAGVDSDPTLRAVLGQATGRIDTELAGEPAVAAALHRTLGLAYYNLSDFAVADEHIARSLALLKGHQPTDTGELMATLIAQGRLAFQQDEHAAAETILREALALGAVDSLRLAAALTEADIVLTHVLATGDDPQRAEATARRAVARSQAIDDPTSRLPAQAVHELGMSHLRLGQYDEAETQVRHSISLLRGALGTGHPLVGEFLSSLALVLRAQERGDEAIEAAREALAIQEQAYAAGHVEIALTRINLGDAYYVAGRPAEAVPLYREAATALQARYGQAHSSVGIAANNLAMALFQSGELEAARTAFGEAVASHRATLGGDHPELAGALSNLAQVHNRLGDRSAAERCCREAVAIQAASLPADHVQLAWGRTFLAELRLDAGDVTEAESLLRASLPPLRAALAPAHRTRIHGEILQGRALLGLQRPAEAEAALISALAIADSVAGPDDANVLRLAAALASLRQEAGLETGQH